MIGQAPAAWNYRTDMFKAAGVDKFPDTFDELLVAARKLHAKGTPIGMTLGHARATPARPTTRSSGRSAARSSRRTARPSPSTRPQTLKAIEWYVEMFKVMDPGVTAWLDPDNNQAFLAGKVSATVNVNTIYLAARDRRARPDDAAKKQLIETMDHANWPAGPAGRFGQLQHQPLGRLRRQQEPRGPDGVPARAGTTRSSWPEWTKVGQSYFIPPLSGIEKEDVWPDDPKLKIFRELNKVNRLPAALARRPARRPRRSPSS